ncbi:F-box/WD repeat-containing protein 7-like isoform X2 [Penaeus japonicus]|uniref:F-box/WD repeat-containing protein 7-like isoform X2 n=1 Tax=Penaeus japonicus TaxID=27405 RepID=UPI001C70C7D8|nr:F-box/WD repeat-containing protein 7-like isoform X2 [Penaeus japonicus]
MPNLEFVKSASDDQKHAEDIEVVSAHGGKLYSGDDEGKVKIWDHDLNLLHEFKAHNYAVTDILVVGNNIFTACADCTFNIWDANTFEFLRAIKGHEESVRKIKTDGKNIFAGDDKGEVRVYSLDGDFEKMYAMVEEVWGLHAEGNRFYTIRDRGLTITEAKNESNKFTVLSSTSEGRAPLYVTSDTLAYMDRAGMVVLIHDNNPGSHKLKGQLKGHDRIVTALSGVENFMVSAGWDNKVKLWDVNTFQELGSCDIPGCANGLAVTDDKLVFAGGIGGFVCKLKIS